MYKLCRGDDMPRKPTSLCHRCRHPFAIARRGRIVLDLAQTDGEDADIDVAGPEFPQWALPMAAFALACSSVKLP